MEESNTEETNPTVLVVDDDAFYLEVLCEHLADEGYVPVGAENGLRAWNLLEETRQTAQTLTLMDHGRFTFRTLKQGRDLVTLLSSALPEASKVVMGLSELVINAIEHGNLGITYEDKSRLSATGAWEEEVERRLALPENTGKTVQLSFERAENEVHFQIQDQGEGFDWRNYLEISPDRAFDTHGRGIAIARTISFDRLEYQGIGNRVIAVIAVNPADTP